MGEMVADARPWEKCSKDRTLSHSTINQNHQDQGRRSGSDVQRVVGMTPDRSIDTMSPKYSLISRTNLHHWWARDAGN
jgi:hypothetical protein